MPKGGGGRPCQKIWITFKGFILLNSIKPLLNLGKMSKGGGLRACQKYWSTFLKLWTTLDFFKSAARKNSVQKPNTFSEANNIKFYTVLSYFAKCRDLRVKVLPDCPK